MRATAARADSKNRGRKNPASPALIGNTKPDRGSGALLRAAKPMVAACCAGANTNKANTRFKTNVTATAVALDRETAEESKPMAQL